MAQTLSSRVLPALVTGAATAAYYATPDLVASRTARGWTKAGLAAVIAAVSWPDYRTGLYELRQARRDAAAEVADRDPVPVRAKVAAGVFIGAAAAGGAVAVVAAERWLFRRGQARSLAGRTWSHTRTGLLLGAVAAGLSLVPLPDPPAPAGADGQE